VGPPSPSKTGSLEDCVILAGRSVSRSMGCMDPPSVGAMPTRRLGVFGGGGKRSLVFLDIVVLLEGAGVSLP
jgi:hypothetical protein